MMSWALWVMIRGRASGIHAPSSSPTPNDAAGPSIDDSIEDLGQQPADTADRIVCNLGWDELTRAWRASTTVLANASTVGTRLAVVSLRAAILDELELRDPRAFSAWREDEQRRLRLTS